MPAKWRRCVTGTIARPHSLVIVLKSGRTEAGKKAVSSHTASLAGNDAINAAAFDSGLGVSSAWREFAQYARAMQFQIIAAKVAAEAVRYRTAFAMQYGSIFFITVIVCLVGAALALFIGGKQARPDGNYSRAIVSPSGRLVGEVGEDLPAAADSRCGAAIVVLSSATPSP